MLVSIRVIANSKISQIWCIGVGKKDKIHLTMHWFFPFSIPQCIRFVIFCYSRYTLYTALYGTGSLENVDYQQDCNTGSTKNKLKYLFKEWVSKPMDLRSSMIYIELIIFGLFLNFHWIALILKMLMTSCPNPSPNTHRGSSPCRWLIELQLSTFCLHFSI